MPRKLTPEEIERNNKIKEYYLKGGKRMDAKTLFKISDETMNTVSSKMTLRWSLATHDRQVLEQHILAGGTPPDMPKQTYGAMRREAGRNAFPTKGDGTDPEDLEAAKAIERAYYK